ALRRRWRATGPSSPRGMGWVSRENRLPISVRPGGQGYNYFWRAARRTALRTLAGTTMSRTYFLGIETSCDETAAAVFTDRREVLANVIASQTELHARFGGVVPEVAARAHLQRLLPVLDEALRTAGMRLKQVGCVAVHNTPGLVGALLVG